MSTLRLLHQIHLAHDAWGGMEKQFANLLTATADDPRVAHYLSEDLRGLAPGVAEALTHLRAPPEDARSWHGVTVPNWRGMRQSRQASQARAWKIDAVLSWNRFGDPRPVRLASRIGAASVYWERGAAWLARSRAPDADFLDGFDRYLAISKACAAMLRYWGVTAPIEICPPGIPRHQPGRLRRLTPQQPLRLGFCAGLQTVKGGVLAVHTLAQLRRLGIDAHLIVAGDGPDRELMIAQAHRLGLGIGVGGEEPSLRFLGRVSPIEEFLDGIDVLLHPALCEPYGNACAEALMAGVPVVAAAVDGLPEVIHSGGNGLCVLPTLALRDYAQFGGDPSGVYPRVYRPEIQRIAEPSVCDPAHLAQAVAELVSEPARYEAYSEAAIGATVEQHAQHPQIERLFVQIVAAIGDRQRRQGVAVAPSIHAHPVPSSSADCRDKAAALIKSAMQGIDEPRVADVGCGTAELRETLQRLDLRCQYQGYDLLPQSSSIQALDISRQPLPQACDLVVLIGVSETLDDLPGVLARLRASVERLVISHNLGDRPRALEELQRLGWRNHLSSDHFERLLSAAGWAVRESLNTDDGKTRLWSCA